MGFSEEDIKAMDEAWVCVCPKCGAVYSITEDYAGKNENEWACIIDDEDLIFILAGRLSSFNTHLYLAIMNNIYPKPVERIAG